VANSAWYRGEHENRCSRDLHLTPKCGAIIMIIGFDPDFTQKNWGIRRDPNKIGELSTSKVVVKAGKT